MRLNFTRTLTDYRGRDILGDDGLPLTLRTVACLALTAVLPGDDKATLEDKMTREGLAGRIWRGEADDVPVETVAAVKERINKVYPSPILVAAAVRVLEGSDDANGRTAPVLPLHEA